MYDAPLGFEEPLLATSAGNATLGGASIVSPAVRPVRLTLNLRESGGYPLSPQAVGAMVSALGRVSVEAISLERGSSVRLVGWQDGVVRQIHRLGMMSNGTGGNWSHEDAACDAGID